MAECGFGCWGARRISSRTGRSRHSDLATEEGWDGRRRASPAANGWACWTGCRRSSGRAAGLTGSGTAAGPAGPAESRTTAADLAGRPGHRRHSRAGIGCPYRVGWKKCRVLSDDVEWGGEQGSWRLACPMASHVAPPAALGTGREEGGGEVVTAAGRLTAASTRRWVRFLREGGSEDGRRRRGGAEGGEGSDEGSRQKRVLQAAAAGPGDLRSSEGCESRGQEISENRWASCAKFAGCVTGRKTAERRRARGCGCCEFSARRAMTARRRAERRRWWCSSTQQAAAVLVLCPAARGGGGRRRAHA